MQDAREQQLLHVLKAIAELQEQHPSIRTTDAEISQMLGMAMDEVHGYMDLLEERGWTDPKNARANRGAYLTRPGRIALRDPSLLNTTRGTTIHSYFDQRGQQVTYQYNAAGDINFAAVQNRVDLIGELEKLKAEVTRAGQAQVIDAEVVTDAEYQLTKAIQQAKKPEADKKTILAHLNTAKSVVVATGATAAAVPGLIDGIQKAIEAMQKLPF